MTLTSKEKAMLEKFCGASDDGEFLLFVFLVRFAFRQRGYRFAVPQGRLQAQRSERKGRGRGAGEQPDGRIRIEALTLSP